MTRKTEHGRPETGSASGKPAAFFRRSYWPVLVICALCIATEAALQVSGMLLPASARLRMTVLEYAGFWPGLLRDWRPNYPSQPYVMFVSYAFLHAGLIHLAVNMITLLSLGRAVIDRVGGRGFLLLYGASVVGGALGFGMLASTLQPMVGASGALFGLAGGLVAWEYVDRFTMQERLWPVARAVLLLIALNLVLWWAMNGQLAWETHLGGFIAGWVAALLVDPRSRAEPPG